MCRLDRRTPNSATLFSLCNLKKSRKMDWSARLRRCGRLGAWRFGRETGRGIVRLGWRGWTARGLLCRPAEAGGGAWGRRFLAAETWRAVCVLVALDRET